MIRRSLIMCVFAFSLAPFCGKGQDVTFSQFSENPLLRNPALAGVFDGDVRVSGGYRNQWQAVSAPFRTQALSAEYKLPVSQQWNDWVTFSLQAAKDQAGELQFARTQLLPGINYHKSLSGNKDDYLSMGFITGPVNSRFDPSRLKMDEQYNPLTGLYDPTRPSGEIFPGTGYTYWDASIGLVFSSGYDNGLRYYVGAGLFHFNEPRISFQSSTANIRVAQKWAFNAGLSLPTSEVHRLDIFTDYFSQGKHHQWAMGAAYQIEFQRSYELEITTLGLSLGANYRYNDAFVPVVKLEVYPFTFGVSYDVNTSALKSASESRGGMELSATFRAKLTSRSYYQDKVRCVR